jgi:hypothetical protein
MQYYVADNNFASLCAKLPTNYFWASNCLNVSLSNLFKFIFQIAWNEHHLDFKTTPFQRIKNLKVMPLFFTYQASKSVTS